MKSDQNSFVNKGTKSTSLRRHKDQTGRRSKNIKILKSTEILENKRIKIHKNKIVNNRRKIKNLYQVCYFKKDEQILSFGKPFSTDLTTKQLPILYNLRHDLIKNLSFLQWTFKPHEVNLIKLSESR